MLGWIGRVASRLCGWSGNLEPAEGLGFRSFWNGDDDGIGAIGGFAFVKFTLNVGFAGWQLEAQAYRQV